MAGTTALVCVLLGGCAVAALAVMTYGRVQIARIQAEQDRAGRRKA